MAAEAEAAREARAKLVSTDGEQRASRALNQAGIMLYFAKSPAVLELRYLRTLNTFASKKKLHCYFPTTYRHYSSFNE